MCPKCTCVKQYVCVVDCVAKWLQHLTVNQKITGSSPTSYHKNTPLSPQSRSSKLGTWLRLVKDKTTGCA